jgi:thioredoxin 1
VNIFEGYIESDKPVIVDFFAGWNQASRLMNPVLQELKFKFGDKVSVIRIDIEKEAKMASLHNIWSVPTLVIFKKGQEVWRKSGIVPMHEMLENISHYLN